MKQFLFLIILFISEFCAFSQNANIEFNSYNRSGLTFVYLKTEGARFSDEISKVFSTNKYSIPVTYDDNRIKKDLIVTKTSFLQTLVENKTANLILDSVFQENNRACSVLNLLQS